MNENFEKAMLTALIWKRLFEGLLKELREIRGEELSEYNS